MGGTMMGVAPQAGGVLPPRGAGPARPLPPPDAVSPESAAEAGTGGAAARQVPPSGAVPLPAAPEPNRSDTGPADALAGTLALPVVAAAPEPPVEAVGAASPAEPVSKGVARTRPLAAVPSPGEGSASGAEALRPEELEDDAGTDPELHGAVTRPPKNRPVAATVALPQQPEASAPGLAPANEPTRARLRPLDVVLIVCTLGVYGVVLWFKQRKPPA